MRQLIHTLPILLCLLASTICSAALQTAYNRFDTRGQRTGWWIVDGENHPTVAEGKEKRKEGYYFNGRKSGPWISYYEDGSSPRLIGEYADNRPRGSFFRFDRRGQLVQAGLTHHRMSESVSFFTDNVMFTCKMMFETSDVFAGQVFFRKRIADKPLSIRFWVASSIESKESNSDKVDFSWLNTSAPVLKQQFDEARTPKLKTAEEVVGIEDLAVNKKPVFKKTEDSFAIREAKRRNYFHPPVVTNPHMTKGVEFQPDGVNRLYTGRSEIWIDGLFRNGQLWSGKVFVYDTDGILLKVRVYREGMYVSDGVL